MTFMAVNCAVMANAETFTAADFTGDDKFCTQLFYGTEMVDKRIQEGAWGRFEAVDGDASKIRLTNFKNEGPVTFTISGDKLTLDGADSKNGAACGSAHLRTVQFDHGVVQKEYYVYEDIRTPYSGTISRDSNGNINVTFDEHYLMFHKRDNNLKAQEIAKDIFNTYSKCELHVYPVTETINDQYPVWIENLSDDENTSTCGIHNYAGAGENFYYAADGTSVALAQGVRMTVNKVSRRTEIEAQPYSGKLEPTFKTKYIVRGGNIGNYSSYGAYVSDLKTGNYVTEGFDSGTIEAEYTVLSREITPGWHKSAGGEFAVTEYASTEFSVSNNYSLGSEDPAPTVYHTEFSFDATPSPELQITSCEFNNDGLLVAGTIFCPATTDAIESYNVYIISGKHETADAEDFDGSLESGHIKGVLIEENLVPDQDNTIYFNALKSRNITAGSGWDLSDNDGELTVYLRYNITTPQSASEGAPRREQTSPVYAFGSMVPRDYNIATGITAVKPAVVSISSKSGALTITGAESATVYDMAGRTVYSGPTGTISLNPGLYIVTAGEMTVKAIVR